MPWLFWGNLMFGFAVGLFSGMSKTPVVSGVLPLLFAFAGGSVIALSVSDGRTPAQLDLLGQELFGFGLGTTIGALLGARLRKKGIDLELMGRESPDEKNVGGAARE